MSDPLGGPPPYSPLATKRDHITSDTSSTSNIPISDFRRNEARPIITDDNDRHKSIYHQPTLPTYNPSEQRRRKRHRRSRPLIESSEMPFKAIPSHESNDSTHIDNPSARVQFLLGDEDQDDDDEEHKPHDLFIELNELVTDGEKLNEAGEPVDQGWKETARWVKFEEDVESGGRWSKPHVATLSLHSLLELRNFISKGSVILDMHAEQLPVMIDIILDDLIANELLSPEKRSIVRSALLLKHVHQHEKEFHRHLHAQEIKKPLPFTRSLAEFSRNRSQKDVTITSVDQIAPSIGANNSASTVNTTQTAGHNIKATGENSPEKFLSVGGGEQSKSKIHENEETTVGLTAAESRAKINMHFMKKVPPNAEATNVLVGAVDFLQTPIYAFVRLSKGVTLPDLIEVPLPTRFLFILLGPCNEHLRYHEVGRSIATLMADEIFHDVAYRARNRDDLLAGIDDFLDHVTVLPPGEWDPRTRIEPPKSVPNKEDRLDRTKINGVTQMKESEHAEHELDPSLMRTGRFCGGLINDIKRKAPFFWSDITDVVSFQSVAAIIFLYFACLSPIITFGGLLSKATDNNMAAIESLLSGAICGCLYHLFAGQPLTILGSTGPVLVFETIVNTFCTSHGHDYMNFRCWIGLWTAAILLIMVVTDASYLVKYITRFTEESFAALIGIIFVYEAFDKMIEINQAVPVRLHTTDALPSNCSCTLFNGTQISTNSTLTLTECYKKQAYDFVGYGCQNIKSKNYVPDVFFFSIILFLSTFVLAYTLKSFKFSRFLPMGIRSKISDFGVVLAIFINVFFDYMIGLDTPKLTVPQKFETTKEGRGWIINPFGKNHVYMWLAALLPALLATILIFMDQQITAVIINRKENKLKKGCGYHLDLLIVAVCIALNSVLGLPWFVAATVLSINHVIALKLESETAAPGEKAKFLGVREQRVTGFIVFLFIGLSIFLTKFLGLIPMPVLYGVFLYMGISSMKEIQLISRILLIFMPEKYQPDYVYLRHVRTRRVHMFTLIQLTCLALLWIIKSIKKISILFPIMVLALVGARKVMDYIFTQRELGYLDDVMPEVVKKEIEERKNSGIEEEDGTKTPGTITFDGEIRIPVGDGKVMKVPTENVEINTSTGVINFSEEVGKTFLWKSISKTKDKEPATPDRKTASQKQPNSDKASRSSALKKRIRKLSLNFLGPDEDRPLVNPTNESSSNQFNQQLPSIVIEQPETSFSSDNNEQRRRTSSTTSNNIDTKL
ncbi:unnamed protein product [Adineta steineri]|uniref:Anion exchange protein n=1 Tax=Adineta steineri TaxID=433720 RepID=A0A814I8E3_9BILA|nr:unnamed protein product [Adineta steineri]CAF1118762.1 unnamed protein product [Adineta steineri]CAF1215968.1 unnamed protein product [Adineta steineri]